MRVPVQLTFTATTIDDGIVEVSVEEWENVERRRSGSRGGQLHHHERRLAHHDGGRFRPNGREVESV